MRVVRISKRHVFPIIITLLVQFHLPQTSLFAVSAAGPMVFAVRIDQDRTPPYREGAFVGRQGIPKSRLLGVSKKGAPVVKSSAGRSTNVVITAYSSTRDQTDASPCITANGYNVCKNNRENVIAANFLPFGTRVKIPELFGDQEFVVQDRMNARYSNRVDIWMTSRARAKQFGVKRAHVVVLPEGRKSAPEHSPTQVAVNF